MTLYIQDVWLIIRSSVTDTAKTPPSIPHPPEIHLYTFWCCDGGRCSFRGVPLRTRHQSNARTLCCGTPAARGEERCLSSAVCCCCFYMLWETVLRSKLSWTVTRGGVFHFNNMNKDTRYVRDFEGSGLPQYIIRPFNSFSNCLYKWLNCVYAYVQLFTGQ